MAMTRQFRDAWYKACTDGSYSSITNRLISPNDPKKRCCLGVALAIGVEQGLLTQEQADQRNIGPKHPQMLTQFQCEALGIKGEVRFAIANDNGYVPEGKFYPDRVIELIQNHPVEE